MAHLCRDTFSLLYSNNIAGKSKKKKKKGEEVVPGDGDGDGEPRLKDYEKGDELDEHTYASYTDLY
jgi:hypothetical protein